MLLLCICFYYSSMLPIQSHFKAIVNVKTGITALKKGSVIQKTSRDVWKRWFKKVKMTTTVWLSSTYFSLVHIKKWDGTLIVSLELQMWLIWPCPTDTLKDRMLIGSHLKVFSFSFIVFRSQFIFLEESNPSNFHSWLFSSACEETKMDRFDSFLFCIWMPDFDNRGLIWILWGKCTRKVSCPFELLLL